MKKILVFSIILIGVFTVLLNANNNNTDYIFGPYIGHHNFLNGSDFKDDIHIGLKFEKYIANPWSYEISAGHTTAKSKNTGEKKDLYLLGLNGIYNFKALNISDFSFTPYIGAGFAAAVGSIEDVCGMDAALGFKYFFGNNAVLKPEIKYIRYFKNNRDDLIVSAMLGFAVGKKTTVATETVASEIVEIPVKEEPVIEQIIEPVVEQVIEPAVEQVIEPVVEEIMEEAVEEKEVFETAKYDETGEIKSITLKVNFETNKSDVKEEYFPEIENFANYLISHSSLNVEIQGHTDNIGNAEYNQKLSESRAVAVREILITKYNVEANRLSAKGYGQTQPVVSNDTEEGRSQNRRIEAVIIK